MNAKEWLQETSPDDKYSLRAELQKHRLRAMVEREMESYHQYKLKKLREKSELMYRHGDGSFLIVRTEHLNE